MGIILNPAVTPAPGTGVAIYIDPVTGKISTIDNLGNIKTYLRLADIPDAAALVKGILQLAGQLGGTAAAPDVRGIRETAGPTLLTLGAVPDGYFLQRSGTNLVGTLVGTGYTLKNIAYYLIATTGTYTPPAGTRALFVECFGGGGGGGGCSTAATNAAAAGGGQGGSYSNVFLTSIASSYSYTVGDYGAGGLIGNNAGSTGGASTFGTGPLCKASGGMGGSGDAVTTLHIGGLGGYNSAANIGDFSAPGQPGGTGFTLAAAQACPGCGGGGYMGLGGAPSLKNITSDGNAATGWGGGGSGAVIISGGTARIGGDGRRGFIRIWEYS